MKSPCLQPRPGDSNLAPRQVSMALPGVGMKLISFRCLENLIPFASFGETCDSRGKEAVGSSGDWTQSVEELTEGEACIHFSLGLEFEYYLLLIVIIHTVL